MKNSELSIDNQRTQFKYISKVCTSSKEYESHMKKWNQKRNETEADVAVGGLFWAVNTSNGVDFGEES